MKTKHILLMASLVFVMLIMVQRTSSESYIELNSGKVRTDIAPIHTAIVLSIGENIFKSSELSGSRHPFFLSGLGPGAIREHAGMIDLLRHNGVRVLDVRDLVQNALINARKAEKLADWLRQVFPTTSEEAIKRINELSADSLLNRRDDHFYLTDRKGLLTPLFPGLPSMYWARDFAISTPKGIIIGNGKFYGRVLENSIANLMFHFSDQLKGFPVVFDARKECVYLDGGDVIVLNEKTLIVGVGNRSSVEAAPKLAQCLGMDVLAVDMPPAEKPTMLNVRWMHLDSIFNLLDSKKALAVPFLLEKKYSDMNPLRQVLLGIAKQLDEMQRHYPDCEMGNSDEIKLLVELIPKIGWVTRYEAGSGKAAPLRLKLVDLFRDDGYEIINVGGEQGSMPAEKYVIERAMYEQRWQGANVLQLRPGRVLAYEHNVQTNEMLRRSGIEVITFPGEILSMRNGGPHCLTMPLIRGE